MLTKDETEIGEVSWNLSQSLIQEIGGLLSKASTFYIVSNIPLALNCLKSVRNRITQSLSKDEREILKSKETSIQVLAGEIELIKSTTSEWDLTKEFFLKKNKLYLLYEDYNETLMDLLEKYSYLISKKQDKTNIN